MNWAKSTYSTSDLGGYDSRLAASTQVLPAGEIRLVPGAAGLVAFWFSPSNAHQSYCRSELLSRSSNNRLRHIRSTLLVIGAGRHGGLARASTPVAQTSRSARRRCSTIHMCASLSAYRGAAALFKLSDVSVAAAQQVPRLVGGFCWEASFNAHGAERDDGTALEWCARCLASRQTAGQDAVTMASRAVG